MIAAFVLGNLGTNSVGFTEFFCTYPLGVPKWKRSVLPTTQSLVVSVPSNKTKHPNPATLWAEALRFSRQIINLKLSKIKGSLFAGYWAYVGHQRSKKHHNRTERFLTGKMQKQWLVENFYLYNTLAKQTGYCIPILSLRRLNITWRPFEEWTTSAAVHKQGDQGEQFRRKTSTSLGIQGRQETFRHTATTQQSWFSDSSALENFQEEFYFETRHTKTWYCICLS